MTNARNAVRAFAPAKVNLTLAVTGRRTDGYHLLHSIVVFADVGDDVVLAPAVGSETRYRTSAGEAAFADVAMERRDTVSRALDGLDGPHPWRADVIKRVPDQAGLGGGSSDAAAALRAARPVMSRDALVALAASVGADVPVCLTPAPAVMEGVGERITPIAPWPAMPAVLAKPSVGASTPAVFARFAASGAAFEGGSALPAHRDPGTVMQWIAEQSNALEPAVEALAPPVGAVREALLSAGAGVARMTGSGTACFGLFETAALARTAAANLARREPTWWVRACVLRGAP